MPLCRIHAFEHLDAFDCHIGIRAGVQHRYRSPGCSHGSRCAIAAVVGGEHSRFLTNPNAVFAQECMSCAGQHNARAVVAFEPDRPLDCAGGVDDVCRLYAVVFHPCRMRLTVGFGEVIVATLNSAKSACIVDPKHSCSRQQAPARCFDLAAQVVHVIRARLTIKALTLPQRRTTHAVALFANDNRLPGLGQRQCSGQPSNPTPDDERVCVGVNFVIVVWVRCHRRAAQTSSPANDRLVQPIPRLQTTKKEGLVVKTRWQEPADQVVDLHQVHIQRTDVVLGKGL